MRLALTLFIATASLALAQQPERTFTTASEVSAMIAKAKSERKPDQANFVQQVLKLAPYTANLESRVEGMDTPATLHETEAEMIYVVEGAAVLTQGGKLVDEKRSNPTNRTGRSIEGGSPRRIAKGDFIFVPANTAHSFTKTEGTLVIMSLHVPKDGAK